MTFKEWRVRDDSQSINGWRDPFCWQVSSQVEEALQANTGWHHISTGLEERAVNQKYYTNKILKKYYTWQSYAVEIRSKDTQKLGTQKLGEFTNNKHVL